MSNLIFRENDRVEVHSRRATSPGVYHGRIRGVSVDFGDSPATVYIVEAKIDKDYGYSCCTIPQSCLRRVESTQCPCCGYPECGHPIKDH